MAVLCHIFSCSWCMYELEQQFLFEVVDIFRKVDVSFEGVAVRRIYLDLDRLLFK